MFPVLNQYQGLSIQSHCQYSAEYKVSCPSTQHSASGDLGATFQATQNIAFEATVRLAYTKISGSSVKLPPNLV